MGTPNRQLRIHRVPDTKTITEQSEITSSAPCRWQQCSFSHFPMESVSCSCSPTQAPSPRPVAPMTRPQSSSQWWTSGPGRRPELSVRPWVPLPGPSPRGRWDLHPCLPATGREGVRAGELAQPVRTQHPAASRCCPKVPFYFVEFPTCPDPQLASSDFPVGKFQPCFDVSGLFNFAAGNRGEACAPAVPSASGELKRGANEWRNERMNSLMVNRIP